ncbi:TetR/AcrR family transcriptional regulator [Saccharopolyspora hirsuta]|uniref:TetR/AcrR family transcriptional regulator n=1 Tax=Saccharopolyspora hirsuta TaxID=1837 RepID=A0A5M7BS85_SACHI|nr:TetR/AcrR family transcriptional regulator [Saccharopolyspora hirsuta]KAA5830094.1 TetR/AcrR family transcriptional regulator [Saccharopolyspora hirsuta]MBF6507457.1 TetR family transcriptional regulator [Nocardia farcinica]
MAASDTRERILDALQRILITKGTAAVTLESVAAEAGVSKGGLLYHFRSKQAMLQGLTLRLDDEAEAEFAQATEKGVDVVRYFLETSLPSSEEEMALYWSVIAALRSAEGLSEAGTEVLARVFNRWSELLTDYIGDPVLAEIVRLVGDGLYLSALSGLPSPDPDLLKQVFDRLLAQVAEARG